MEQEKKDILISYSIIDFLAKNDLKLSYLNKYLNNEEDKEILTKAEDILTDIENDIYQEFISNK